MKKSRDIVTALLLVLIGFLALVGGQPASAQDPEVCEIPAPVGSSASPR